MPEQQWLAERFESHRDHLQAVAYRMLGSTTEADDAVQEAWLRLTRVDPGEIDNLGGWLTTVVGRVSLDMLRQRSARREASDVPANVVPIDRTTPEDETLLADSVGSALLVVLDTLSPAERLAFVLHDVFAVPFEEIGPIVGRSPAAARQLASRGRRRVQGSNAAGTPDDPARAKAVVDAFLAASRGGDFDALVALLHPDVALEADTAAAAMGSPASVHGPAEVAGMFSGRALAAQAAVIDGAPGMVWIVGGKPKVAWEFTVVDGVVARIDMLASPEALELAQIVIDE
jgi:RNA polymerase sigma-70 factor (ECF subfamily)